VQNELITDSRIIETIVREVIRRIKMYENCGLLIIPSIHKNMAEEILRLINSMESPMSFDLVSSRLLESSTIQLFVEAGIHIRNQLSNTEEIDFNRYKRIVVLNIDAALIREVKEIRPYTFEGEVLLKSISMDKHINILSSPLDMIRDKVRPSAFDNVVIEDINLLKIWGVHFSTDDSNAAFLNAYMVTAAKLSSYENQTVHLPNKAVITDMANEQARKKKIILVRQEDL